MFNLVSFWLLHYDFRWVKAISNKHKQKALYPVTFMTMETLGNFFAILKFWQHCIQAGHPEISIHNASISRVDLKNFQLVVKNYGIKTEILTKL